MQMSVFLTILLLFNIAAKIESEKFLDPNGAAMPNGAAKSEICQIPRPKLTCLTFLSPERSFRMECQWESEEIALNFCPTVFYNRAVWGLSKNYFGNENIIANPNCWANSQTKLKCETRYFCDGHCADGKNSIKLDSFSMRIFIRLEAKSDLDQKSFDFEVEPLDWCKE